MQPVTPGQQQPSQIVDKAERRTSIFMTTVAVYGYVAAEDVLCIFYSTYRQSAQCPFVHYVFCGHTTTSWSRRGHLTIAILYSSGNRRGHACATLPFLPTVRIPENGRIHGRVAPSN